MKRPAHRKTIIGAYLVTFIDRNGREQNFKFNTYYTIGFNLDLIVEKCNFMDLSITRISESESDMLDNEGVTDILFHMTPSNEVPKLLRQVFLLGANLNLKRVFPSYCNGLERLKELTFSNELED